LTHTGTVASYSLMIAAVLMQSDMITGNYSNLLLKASCLESLQVFNLVNIKYHNGLFIILMAYSYVKENFILNLFAIHYYVKDHVS